MKIDLQEIQIGGQAKEVTKNLGNRESGFRISTTLTKQAGNSGKGWRKRKRGGLKIPKTGIEIEMRVWGKLK
ncbi:hypothetical protein [Streptomyces cinereoruber]|uniref:hypothetical protein n=1 Tax=Streptomyces cinereoruber TaxID=67260 RepID=UPI003634AA13